jgi:DNA polymerase-4
VRVACVWLPHFPVAIERRNRPALDRRSVIIGETPDQRGAVLDCSAEAETRGACVGMPLRQALGLCPSASFLPPDLPRYGDAFDQILHALETISPLVEPAALGCAFVGLGGLNGHYRDEMALGDALAHRAATPQLPLICRTDSRSIATSATSTSTASTRSASPSATRTGNTRPGRRGTCGTATTT